MATRAKAADQIPESNRVQIALRNLKVDHVFQEAHFNRAFAESIAERFDWNLWQEITVSARANGDNMVLDGQHRVYAANSLFPPSTKVWCIAHYNLRRDQEAALAVALNENRRPWLPVHIFMGRVEAREETAVKISDIMRRHGWRIGNQPREGMWRSVVTADKIYNLPDNGPRILDRVVDILTAAWGHDADAARAAIVEGISGVLWRHPKVDDSALVTALGRIRPAQLYGDTVTLARLHRWPLAKAAREVIIDLHDYKRSRYRLKARDDDE